MLVCVVCCKSVRILLQICCVQLLCKFFFCLWLLVCVVASLLCAAADVDCLYFCQVDPHGLWSGFKYLLKGELLMIVWCFQEILFVCMRVCVFVCVSWGWMCICICIQCNQMADLLEKVQMYLLALLVHLFMIRVSSNECYFRNILLVWVSICVFFCCCLLLKMAVLRLS